jgi:hypothetical protein
MSESKVKSQVRPEHKIRKIGKVARGTGGRGSDLVGIVDLVESSDLPSASVVGDGVLIYNLTSGKLQITVSGSWTDVA